MTKLEWSQVDVARRVAWVHPDQAKADEHIGVPLNDDAMAVVRRQIGLHPRRVFTFEGRPVAKAGSTAWRKALDRAGIRKFVDPDRRNKRSPYPHFKDEEYLFADFRWHDLRHTWASWHVQAGTPLNVLQELGGWHSIEMAPKYAHLGADQLADYASRIEGVGVQRGAKLVALDGRTKK